MAKRRIPLTTDVYRHDSRLLAEAFDAALEQGDAQELARILSLASQLFRQLLRALRSKYGNRPRMSGRTRYTWKDWLPAEVMGDLRNAKEIEEDWVIRAKEKVPKLSKKAQREAKKSLKKVEQELRARVRAGKKWINERWPGWWTPDVERDFKDWL